MPLTMTITAADPAATSITVLDGTPTGAWCLLDGADFGDAVWDIGYSGPRGTLGALPASSRVGNRTVSLGLALWPDDMDDSAAHQAQMARLLDLMRQYGGRLTFQRTDQAHRQHLLVLTGGVTGTQWAPRSELDGRTAVRLQLICEPYVSADSMRITDTFVSDTEADYTFDAGSAANVTVGSGQFKSSATATNHYAVHTASGFLLGDHQATARINPAAITNHGGGVLIKRVNASTLIRAIVFDDGATSILYLDQVVAGVVTNLASTALTRITVGAPYHVAGRIEGNTVYAEYWAPGNFPTLSGTATSQVSAVLTGSAKTTFGEGTTGQAGPFLYPANSADAVEWFQIRPFVYRGTNFTDRYLAGHYRLDGQIPGDAPARAEIEVAVGPGGSAIASTARFGLIGHTPRAQTHNLLPDGGFELIETFQQWSHSAVTGVMANAGTSITRVTTAARYGAACGQVVAPATANSGARCIMYRPFRAGVTYTAELWIRAASGTTNARIRLGVNGDIASETASALSSGWVRRTVTWTPTASVTAAYLVAEITAATATTFQIDGCMVYEGTTAPTLASQRDGMAGRPPFGIIDAVDRMGSNGTVDLAAGGTYLNGRRLTFSATTGTGDIDVLLDPGLLPRDPHSPAQAVEVYLMAHVPTSVQTTIVTSLGPVGNNPAVAETYPVEYGADGLTTTPGTPNNFHLFRLGTLSLPTPGAGVIAPMRLRIVQSYASNQTFHWNYLLIVPAGQRACSPTGVADLDGYPFFAQTGQTTAVVRRFTDDLQGYTQATGTPHQIPAPPLDGALITPGPGHVDFLAAVAGNVPGVNAVYNGVNGFRLGAIAITPTPRYHYLRDA